MKPASLRLALLLSVALNLGVIGTIVMSWLITLPAGAGLSILFFFTFKGIFG